ncbi:MAG: glycosyltransferase family 39 protein [Anaerolineae bacterium]|nr:glycosyltransferase family 39 protein [Anaerolineae bacterium]
MSRFTTSRFPRLALALVILLLAAGLRIWQLGTLPPGFSAAELRSLRITEQVQTGRLVVFAQASENAAGQETLFHITEAVLGSMVGNGLISLRLPAVFSGLLTLAMLYALGRRLYGRRAAWIATTLMAFGFWPVLLSRLALRETFVPLFTVGALLLLMRAFHISQNVSPDPPLTTAYAVLGVALAASLYTHWYGLFLTVTVTVLVAYLFLSHQQISRRAAGASAFAILISIIVSMPYVVTTLRMPEASGLAALGDALLPDNALQSIFSGLGALIGRGDLNPAFNVPGRPLFDPVTAVLVLYGLWLSLSHWRRPSNFIPALAALIGLVPVLLNTSAGSFLTLVGVLPLLYLLAGHAASDLLADLTRFRPAQRRLIGWLPVILVGFNLIWTGADLFGGWNYRQDVLTTYNAARGLLARHLDETSAELPTVVCSPRLIDTDVHRGDPHLLALMMQRDDAPLRYVDCANALLIADGGERQQLAFTDVSVYDRMYPFLLSWLDHRPSLLIDRLDPRSVLELNMQQLLGNTVGRLLTTAPTGWAPESPGGPGPATLPVRFSGNLTFLGYVPERVLVYQPGDIVPVITYWRADGIVPPDVRLFVHVLSDPAAIAAQSQAINVMPGTLHNRDVFIQVSYVVLPESMPPGQYDLSIGAFQAESGLRLPVYDGESERGDRLFLYQITVGTEEAGGGEAVDPAPSPTGDTTTDSGEE